MTTRKFNQLLVSLGVTITLLANAYPQSARTVMVQSNTGTLLFPTNLWSANASAARTGLGLGTAATNDATAFQTSSAVLSNLASSNAVNLTNIRATNIVGVLSSSNVPSITLTNISGTLAVESGGTAATNAAGARTNLGLSWSGLTNSNTATFLTAIGFNPTNSPSLAGLTLTNGTNSLVFSASVAVTRTNLGLVWTGLTNSSSEDFRSALGLGLPALTNTNTTNFLAAFFGANTNPVLVNTSGVVTSPTNFWTYAPGAVVIQDFTTNVLSSATNQVTSARSVFVYSFSTNIIVSGSVHTLELPTNASSGDFVTVTHSGTTSSPTAVRVAGTTNNLVSLSQIDEQVRFVYRNSAWRIDPPRALTTPLYFSGSSATANAAASRTNLGIPLAALTSTDVTNFRSAIGLPLAALTNTDVTNFRSAIGLPLAALTNTDVTNFRSAIGLPLAALTNTNEANFQAAIFTNTNTPPNVATNFTNFVGWISIKVGTLTNNYRIPVYQ